MISFKLYEQDAQRAAAYEELLVASLPMLDKTGSESDLRKYSESTGWYDIDEWANEAMLDEITTLADKIRENADVFVIIGVGGSNNAARSVIEAFPDRIGPEIVYAGCSLSPWAMNQVLKKIQGKSVYIDCIAKNFQTLEPGSSFRVLRKYMYDTYGEAASERIIATGTRGTLLEQICEEQNYTFVEFPMNVGGRFTAMTAVGLLPMAVAGIDIRELIEGAREMVAQLADKNIQQTAYRYAVARNFYYQEGYRMEMLACFEPQMHDFFEWWIQLFAESEGKDNKGLYPIRGEYSEELHSVGQFLQDGTPVICETFMHFKTPNDSHIIQADTRIRDDFDYLDGKDFSEVNEAAFWATLKAHNQKMPCMLLDVDRLDAHGFGQIFYFFMYTCYLSAQILGVNPFDQEGVEAYKKGMFAALGKK